MRRLSSMSALRAVANVADVPLKRKLRNDYAKLRARGHLRNFTRFASADTRAASVCQSMINNSPTHTTGGGKRPRSQDDLGHDVQKDPKHKFNLAVGVPRMPMCSQTQSTHATLPDTGIGHKDDVVSVVSGSETEDTHAYRPASVVAGVPVAVHAKLVLQVKGLQETLKKTYCMLDAMQSRLQAMERAQT
uniref:Uncharacterized protein n=1 Tax=Peronospora matthiolae TaxID=2874970 RepID=A0AAV1U0P6_9STRA